MVYVVGEDGILEELKLAGFECFGGPVRLAYSPPPTHTHTHTFLSPDY
jgi:hypothetical protein